MHLFLDVRANQVTVEKDEDTRDRREHKSPRSDRCHPFAPDIHERVRYGSCSLEHSLCNIFWKDNLPEFTKWFDWHLEWMRYLSDLMGIHWLCWFESLDFEHVSDEILPTTTNCQHTLVTTYIFYMPGDNLHRNRKPYLDAQPASCSIGGLHTAAMRRQNAVSNCQAEAVPVAIFMCAVATKKWLKDMLQLDLRHSRAFVEDGDA